jgi:hypothetical protein
MGIYRPRRKEKKMSGFNNNVKVTLNVDEVDKLLKKYKKIKKYMKSNFYHLNVVNGTETVVSKLLSEVAEDPPTTINT